MKKRNINILLAILLVLELGSIFLMYKSFNNKKVVLDEVGIREYEEFPSNLFAIMIQTDTGYVPYNENTWPTGMILNSNKSGCIDAHGKKIDAGLSFSNGAVSINSGVTAYCYLYFDNGFGNKIVEQNTIINKTLVADMYRFQGSNTEVTSNYICFGTSDKDTCTANPDKYMYRIIGITEAGLVKVIKKEALENTMQWWTSEADVPWYAEAGNKSLIYTNLNGSEFLENKTYVPDGWENKIADVAWKYGNLNGLSDSDWDATRIYDVEQAWNQSVLAKVGIMYISDYTYSNLSINCVYAWGDASCATNWMNLPNNDANAPSTSEVTMDFYTCSEYDGNTYCNIASLESDGGIQTIMANPTTESAIRPVFYITNSSLEGGTGLITDPYIIK